MVEGKSPRVAMRARRMWSLNPRAWKTAEKETAEPKQEYEDTAGQGLLKQALEHDVMHVSGGVEMQKKFKDRTRLDSRRRASLRYSIPPGSEVPVPTLPTIQGYTESTGEAFLGDGDGYLSDEDTKDARMKRRFFRLRRGYKSSKSYFKQEETEADPRTPDLVTKIIFESCRCVRVLDGNSILVEVVPKYLPVDVFNAHSAYIMAKQQGAIASTRKFMQDITDMGYHSVNESLLGRYVRVRLRAVTAPRRGQSFHEESITFLREKLEGKNVQVLVYWKDSYKRAVSDVMVLDDRTMVSVSLLKSGLAWYAADYDANSDLYSFEFDARQENLGIWSNKNPSPPWPV